MQKRLKWHRSLVFTGPMPDGNRLKALVATLPASWRSDPLTGLKGQLRGGIPYSYFFERRQTAADPCYRFELCAESSTHGYLLGTIEEKSRGLVTSLDEWNHLAELFEAEVVAPAAKAMPGLTYRFAPTFQAPEDWYGPEACALLRKSLSGSKCPCTNWLSPKAEAWMGFLDRINAELEDHYIPDPLRSWLERFSGWTQAEMKTMETSSELLLAYIQMKMVERANQEDVQDEAASTIC